MNEQDRIITPKRTPEDEIQSANPVSLRPNCLDDFIGQRAVCDNLKVFI